MRRDKGVLSIEGERQYKITYSTIRVSNDRIVRTTIQKIIVLTVDLEATDYSKQQLIT